MMLLQRDQKPSLDPSTDGAGGQGPGSKWFEKAVDVCLSCILLDVSSDMPSTCQRVALRGRHGDVVSSCAGKLRIQH